MIEFLNMTMWELHRHIGEAIKVWHMLVPVVALLFWVGWAIGREIETACRNQRDDKPNPYADSFREGDILVTDADGQGYRFRPRRGRHDQEG